jgi:phosphatidylserine decarboxylase
MPVGVVFDPIETIRISPSDGGLLLRPLVPEDNPPKVVGLSDFETLTPSTLLACWFTRPAKLFLFLAMFNLHLQCLL